MDMEVKGLEQIQKRAQDGDVLAQVELAACLRKGRGVRRNMKEALQWLQKAGEQKSPEALYQLGRCAEDGNGMPMDEKMAADYYRRAAESGHMDAQYAYAVCKQAGIGCTQNLEDGLYWMEKAADQGHENARLQLEKLREECDRLQQIRKDQQKKAVAIKQQEMTLSADPVPYQMPKKDVEAEKHEQVKKLEPPPVKESAKRNSVPFIVIYALSGIIFGVCLYQFYPNMPNTDELMNGTGYVIWLGLVSGFLGAGMGYFLHWAYEKATEPLPLFGPLLLLPLLIFFLGGAITSVLMFIVSVIIKILGIILVVVIVFAIIGFFMG